MTSTSEVATASGTTTDLIEVAATDIDTFMDEVERRTWGDGLPVIPPTPERVARAVEASGRPADEVIGVIPVRRGVATVEVVAANAVMAGCRPEYMPVVIAAVRAAVDPTLNLTALQATTHPASTLVIVNGPIAKQLKMNGGAGAFGPGNRANASIGRALRLTLLNVGDARPGVGDFATQGHPGKYTYCIAENEDANPWGSLAQARGFDAEQSTVTVATAESPHNINEHVGETAQYVLDNISATVANIGSNNPHVIQIPELWIFLCPEHVDTISSGGFDRQTTQRFLYEHARLPLGRLKQGPMWGMHEWPLWMEGTNPDAQLPIAMDPERFNLVVVGGTGRQSAWAPSNGGGRSVTVAV